MDDQDFRFSVMPNWFSDFWNYPRQRAIGLLMMLLAALRLPRFSILVGPPGSGKSAAALAIGRWSACDAIASPEETPCGTCAGCQRIRYGGDFWWSSPFLELSQAHYKDQNILARALENCQPGGRRMAWCGERPRNLVLLLNEAQELPQPQKAMLLTGLEQMENVYVLATTTNINKLQLEPDRPAKEDPLISRGTIFRFDHPLIAEAAAGLLLSAARVGLTLTEAAAVRIAKRNAVENDLSKASARDCLADLSMLAACGPHIDGECVEVLDGGVDSTPAAVDAVAADGDAEDGGLY